jgi:hypothetical protein
MGERKEERERARERERAGEFHAYKYTRTTPVCLSLAN